MLINYLLLTKFKANYKWNTIIYHAKMSIVLKVQFNINFMIRKNTYFLGYEHIA